MRRFSNGAVCMLPLLLMMGAHLSGGGGCQ